MAEATQVKKGYLRGVKGVLLIPLNEDGSKPEVIPVKHWVDTSQEVSVEAEVVEGESDELRGGDQILVRIEEEDVVVGANLGFRDARFDAWATELIAGGNLIVNEDDPTEIVGWEAPTIAEQYKKKPFEAEVYVQSFNAAGGRESYLRYLFRYCKGYSPNVTHSDQEWGTPEFSIKARENPSTLESTYKKEFVPVLPISPPTGVEATLGAESATVKWDAVPGAISYNVYKYQGSEAPVDPDDWEIGEEDVTALQVEVTPLTHSVPWVFAVTAVNKAGETGLSEVPPAVTPTE